MIDLNDVAALLHIEEKLRGHPQFKNMYAAVMAKLQEHEAAHAPPEAEPIPAPVTKGLQPSSDEEWADDPSGQKNDPPGQKTQDQMLREPQPRVPDPIPSTDLSRQNNLPGERIEDRLQGAQQSTIERRV